VGFALESHSAKREWSSNERTVEDVKEYGEHNKHNNKTTKQSLVTTT
jgi:hypothetical protein